MKILAIDTIEFGIDINNYNENFFDLLNQLENLKSLSQKELQEQVININGVNFSVNRKGQGFYRYKIECIDFYICLMKNDIRNNSPIYVRFMSEFLWKHGYNKCHCLFWKWFNQFNVKVLGTRLSRLDICFDTEEICFTIEDREKFVTRARKTDIHYTEEEVQIDSEHYIGHVFSGFVIGRGSPLSCRIYNKTLEAKNSKKWFFDIWKEYGYNSLNDVWRVEFQCRRKVLKELQINTYEDIKEKIKQIWAYYTQKWLVLKEKTNNNISRCPISEKWLLIQKCGGEYMPSPSVREKIRSGNLEKLFCQCKGLFTSISALTNTSVSEAYFMIEEYIRLKNKENKTTFAEEVEKRKNRFLK